MPVRASLIEAIAVRDDAYEPLARTVCVLWYGTIQGGLSLGGPDGTWRIL